jgi:hypothetical protein
MSRQRGWSPEKKVYGQRQWRKAWATGARRRHDRIEETDVPEFVVISDLADDPWEEGAFASRQDAEAYVERILRGIAAEGLAPDEWRPLLRVEERRR